MDEPARVELTQPRFEHGHFLLIAGLGGQFTQQTTQGIPEPVSYTHLTLPTIYSV